jgi:hypothetical protein
MNQCTPDTFPEIAAAQYAIQPGQPGGAGKACHLLAWVAAQAQASQQDRKSLHQLLVIGGLAIVTGNFLQRLLRTSMQGTAPMPAV